MRLYDLGLSIFCLLFNSTICSSQKSYNDFSANIGVQSSVGPTVQGKLKSEIQNLEVQYFPYKRYRNPALRIRANNTYYLSEMFGIGVESGITVHFLEDYYDGLYRTTIAIPIMFKMNLGTQIKKGRGDLSLLAGYNYLNIDQYPFHDQGGFIYDLQFGYKFKSRMCVSTGFELQVDNVTYTHIPPSPGSSSIQETFKYKQKRRQVYFSFGFIF